MKFIYSDGGRSNYFKGHTGDCVVRAICNATGLDYKFVYDFVYNLQGSSPRKGVWKQYSKKAIRLLGGFEWVPCMSIGSGCKIHLCSEDLPKGILILQLSHHLTCVKDGVLYDTYDCSRNGTRCVYGYWILRS